MKRRMRLTVLIFLLLLGATIGACQPEEVVVEVTRVVEGEVTRIVTETIVEEGESVEVTRVVTEEVVVEIPAEEEEAGSGFESEEEPAAETDIETIAESETERPGTNNAQAQRLIIKDGNMTLIAMEPDAVLEEAIDLAVDLGGYVISQRVWDDEAGFRFATVQLGVPVDRFEEAMRTLRTFGSVTDESASGQDVTDEYVDLNSRLGNLLATQERLRSFLESADEVAEILAINEELKEIEEELEIVQGRMTYLADRAAVSTINLTINPLIPTATPTHTPTSTPTPTPTPTYTPTPLPTPAEWRPGDTAHTALVSLENSSTSAADFAIYNGITCGPWLLLTGIVSFFFWRVLRWRVRRDTPLAGEPAGSD
jgi:hypothetical protein